MKKDNSSTESISHPQKQQQNQQQENFSAAFLFQILDSISEPIFVKNRQHEWVLLNETCCQLLGLTREEIIGKTDYDLFPEEKADLLWGKDELVFSTGIVDESEESINTINNEKHFVSTRKCLFIDEKGNPFLLTQLRDITQRIQPYKEIENQLRESKHFLELVMDGLPQAIFWKDCKSVYQGCNRLFAEIAGVENPENIIGKTDYDLFWNHDDIKWLRESDRKVIESGVPEYGGIYRRLQADGKPCWLEINKILIKNSDNQTIGILGTFQDVTEQKELEVNLAHFYEELEVRVEERTTELNQVVSRLRQEVQERQKVENQLRKSQELLRMVIDNIPQLIFWKDSNSKYLGCNTNFAKFVGLNSSSAIVGKTDDDLNLPLKKIETADDISLMNSGKSLLHHIEKQKQETGEFIWIDVSKIPLHDHNNKVVGILGAYEDITERKTIEEVLRQTESKFRRISANLPGMLYQFKMTAGGKLSFPYVSSGCDRLFGFTAEEIQSDAGLMVSAIHRDEQEEFADSIAESAKLLESWHWEGRIVHRNGQIKWIQATSRPEKQADNSIIWDGIVLDISRRKQAERNLEIAYTELEKRVEKRTQQLAQSNVSLQTEITERQKVEENLRASQHRLALLIAQTPLGVIEWDLNCCIQEWNRAAEKIFGFTKEEVLGRHLEFLLPQNVKEKTNQVTSDLLLEQVSNRSINENLTKDGNLIFCDWYNNSLINTNGQLIGIASMVVDITERKQAEVILKESEAKFRTLVNNNLGAIYRCFPDLDRTMLFISDVIEEISGYDASDFIKSKVRTLNSIVHPEDMEKVECTINLAVSRKESYTLEYRIINVEGNVCWVCEKGQAIYNQKDVPMYIDGGIFDISEHKAALHQRQEAEAALKLSENQLREKAEELEKTLDELKCTQMQLIQSEKMSSLGQLVAGVAHEINNPVNFIYGNLTYIDQYTQDLFKLLKLYEIDNHSYSDDIEKLIDDIDLEFVFQDLPKVVDSMQSGSQRIKEIVASLRTFSRLDEAQMKKVDIHEGIEATLMILQYRFKNEFNLLFIEIVKDYDDLPLIECYAGLLNQVFMNILSNAIDAIDHLINKNKSSLEKQVDKLEENQEYKPLISITTKCIAGEKVQVIFSDNGCGIPADILPRLFDPFFTTKPVGKGTGMGLSTSYQIITQKHGGILECYSQEGKGSSFILTIPCKQNEKYFQH